MSEWISVYNRMPEEEEDVLFFDNMIYTGYWAYYEYCDGKKVLEWFSNCGGTGREYEIIKFHPTHWMPLPNSPKEI